MSSDVNVWMTVTNVKKGWDARYYTRRVDKAIQMDFLDRFTHHAFSVELHPDTAREIAERLLKLADEADPR